MEILGQISTEIDSNCNDSREKPHNEIVNNSLIEHHLYGFKGRSRGPFRTMEKADP
jgi:hypothetical protein